MTDPRVEKLAEILVDYSCEVEAGDYVAIYASPEAEPLVRALYRKILRAGGYPYPFMGYEVYFSYGGFDDIFFEEASKDQLQHVFRTDHMVLTEFDAMISVRSQRNTRVLSGVDSERLRLRQAAYSDLLQQYLERGARRELKWAVTLYPTFANAQEADMTQENFADFVYGACYADRDDAIEIWRGLAEEQQRRVEWFKGKKQVEIKGSNVDLKLSVEGRTFVNADGRFNMPDGEIFTGPVEDSAEGWVRFTYPANRYGVAVEGIELKFETGRVVEASAEKNEDHLLGLLDTDAGSRYLGEFAIATNKRIDKFISNILFDEKIGGSFHLAIGSGYPETGSKNRSGIHWDMICDLSDDGEIWVDGELLHRHGEFVLDPSGS